MTKTPTQSIASYFKPYAIPHYTTHAENIVKWLDDDGWDIVLRDDAESAGKPLSELEGEARDRGFQHGLMATEGAAKYLDNLEAGMLPSNAATPSQIAETLRTSAPPKPSPDAMREALEKIVGLAGPSGKTASYQWGAAFAIASAVLATPVRPADGARSFCLWLQDYFRKTATYNKDELTAIEANTIRNTLNEMLGSSEPLYTSPPIRGNQQAFYTILSKYFPKDATFDNLWQELKEAGLV